MVAYDDKFRGILKDLISDDPARATPALEFMSVQGIEVYEPLFLALQDTDSNLRQAAAVASLTLPHPLGAGLTPALRVCLEDPQAEVRIAAAQGLRSLSPVFSDIQSSFQTVLELLSNDNCVDYAIPLLKTFPAVEEHAPDSLLRFLNHSDCSLAITAAETIAFVFPASIDPALTLLQKFLKAPLPKTRCEAALTLAQIRKAAAPAVPALIEILEDQDDSVRKAAIKALGSIACHGEQAIPAIVRTLSDPNRDLRVLAAVALGRFEDDATEAIVGAFYRHDPGVNGLLFIALVEAGVDVMEDVLSKLESTESEPISPSVLRGLRRKIASEVGQVEDESALPEFVIAYQRMDESFQEWQGAFGGIIILVLITALIYGFVLTI